MATREVYPLKSEGRLCDECSTGDVVSVEDAELVIQAGGIFAYARETIMLASFIV